MTRQPLRIAPSLLAADFARLGEEVIALERAGADYIHIDVMDGHFAPNITVGPAVIKALRPYSRLPFDVHLMIAPVDAYIAGFVAAGADIISFHPEAGPHPHRTVQLIRSLNCRAGVALNPGTPVESMEYLLDALDLVLVMSVNPGFGGQSFINSQTAKIGVLRRRIDASGRKIDLEVDGGVTPATAKICFDAGADVLVAGTASFAGGPGCYAANIADLRAVSSAGATP